VSSLHAREVTEMRLHRVCSGSLVLLGLVLAAGLAATARAAAAPAQQVYDARSLSREQFQRLPDNAVIVARGKRFTAAELRARARRNAEAIRKRTAAVDPQALQAAKAVRAKFLQGQKSKLAAGNATVRARFAALHQNTLARAAIRPPPGPAVPEITEIVGAVTPGAALEIRGKNFGYDGQVLLKGLPQGIVVLPLDPGYLFPWLQDSIAVVVPDITGVDDLPATIQVDVKNGLGSLEKPVSFLATDEIVDNPPATLISCSEDATDNRCDALMGYWSFSGMHVEDTLWEVDALGCDQWTFTLHNGWTVYWSHMGGSNNPDGSVGITFYPAVGSTHYEWQACWRVNGAGPYSGNTAMYTGLLTIKGHKGVPW
jgi:hypothetical protein